MNGTSPFHSIVFSGGGNRCFWQMGFWAEAAPALGIKPAVVAGTSAGATMACAIFSGVRTFALNHMKRVMAENARNIYPGNILRRQPVFPHEAIYRHALLTIIDQSALERLHAGPDIRVLMARPPWWIGPRLAALLGFACYTAEKKLTGPIHSTFCVRAGFRPMAASVRDCHTPEELADLLLASSCTPPVTSLQRWENRAALDGGLIDNAPYRILGPGSDPALIFLTRSHPPEKIPVIPGRVYVQPSRPIPVSKWDYTDPDGLQKTFDLGRRDGERFAVLYRETMGPDRDDLGHRAMAPF